MTHGRAAGVALVVAGVAAGTILGRAPARQSPKSNEYFVLTGDFHVHAAIGDGAIAPWELRDEARRRSLDVIVITNHNQRLAARLAAASLAPRGAAHDSSLPLVLVGQEVTTPSFHLVAAGIRETIDWRLSASDAIRAIHAQGGVAIAAHPVSRSWRAEPDAVTLLDGVEAAHPLAIDSPRDAEQLLQFFRRSAARNPSLAPIGSSDFHVAGTLGECRTFLFVRDRNASGVLEAIREARTVASCRDGRFIGDPSLVAVVERLVAADRSPSAADIWSRIAAWSTLLGLLILLLWG